MNPAYASSQKAIHWVVFVLVIGLYGLTYVADIFPRGDPGRAAVWWLHISFGLLLFALVVIRVGLRLALGTPGLPPEMSQLERWAAKIAHLLLYALLVAIPVLGIILTWYRGDALSFFGLFTIPAPVSADRAIAGFIRRLHSLCADLILILAGLHAAAALWHHYVWKDDVLRRMLLGKSGS
ncbi:cytochrome b [Mesorhizobium erdmanii]|uniref:Cytochrome b n=1 Tax=Mesorhizobium erdmanii TaxID=1777866 RepID=A0A6M7UPB4_9HYPH|nr:MULTISPECIES: cytochrome b [Mesorhizobium]OBQ71207.1 cytochrome B [Mesorhizobium loti]QKC78904.1 cytochrome b [Mesorhizobium erdmanii]